MCTHVCTYIHTYIHIIFIPKRACVVYVCVRVCLCKADAGSVTSCPYCDPYWESNCNFQKKSGRRRLKQRLPISLHSCLVWAWSRGRHVALPTAQMQAHFAHGRRAVQRLARKKDREFFFFENCKRARFVCFLSPFLQVESTQARLIARSDGGCPQLHTRRAGGDF